MEGLYEVLQQLLVLVLTILASTAVAYLKKKYGVEKMRAVYEDLQAKQEIVATVVLFVQQVYEELDGAEKYDKAVETASLWLKNRGLKVSSGELESLIESSIKTLKTEFAEQWWSATNEEAK